MIYTNAKNPLHKHTSFSISRFYDFCGNEMAVDPGANFNRGKLPGRVDELRWDVECEGGYLTDRRESDRPRRIGTWASDGATSGQTRLLNWRREPRWNLGVVR